MQNKVNVCNSRYFRKNAGYSKVLNKLLLRFVQIIACITLYGFMANNIYEPLKGKNEVASTFVCNFGLHFCYCYVFLKLDNYRVNTIPFN